MEDLLATINGIDVLLFALGAAIMAVTYEVVLHRQRRRFDRRLDATWDRAFDEGWLSGWSTHRTLYGAIANLDAEAKAARRP